MKQKTVFLEQGEADAWFTRNLGSLGKYDPVTPLIEELQIKPKCVLEVGCANGWRLDRLRSKYDCIVVGIEPSMKAGVDGARLRVPIHQMTASTLPVTPGGYDMIIYGFCLYLTDPEDWFAIAAEADRALAPNGHIIIHDFAVETPAAIRAKPYEHRQGLMSYHYDFPRLWRNHPLYRQVRCITGQHDDVVTVLRKYAVKDMIEVTP